MVLPEPVGALPQTSRPGEGVGQGGGLHGERLGDAEDVQAFAQVGGHAEIGEGGGHGRGVLLHRGGRHAHTRRGGSAGCRSRVECSDSSAAPGWQSQATARHGPPAAAGVPSTVPGGHAVPTIRVRRHGTGHGAEDVADPRAVPRPHLLRAGGDGRVRGAGRDGLRRLLRVASRPHGGRAGGGRDRDVLQLQPRRSCATPSPRRGRSPRPPRLLDGPPRGRRRRAAASARRPAWTTRRCGRAAELARTATEGCTAAGRPLYAAHASLPWPDAPHLALWHAITLLREFRGDGHIACLVDAGLDGIDALVAPRRLR